jgi:hypothetical protein
VFLDPLSPLVTPALTSRQGNDERLPIHSGPTRAEPSQKVLAYTLSQYLHSNYHHHRIWDPPQRALNPNHIHNHPISAPSRRKEALDSLCPPAASHYLNSSSLPQDLRDYQRDFGSIHPSLPINRQLQSSPPYSRAKAAPRLDTFTLSSVPLLVVKSLHPAPRPLTQHNTTSG